MVSFLLSRACPEPRPFLPLTHPTNEGLGGHKGLGGDTAGTVTPADPRDVPHHMALRSAHRAGGRRGMGGTFGVMPFAFPSHRYT